MDRIKDDNASLLIESIGDQRRHFGLEWSRTYSIGRGQDNDISIYDQAISRHHAKLEDRDGQWWLEDLGSSNGVIYNGKQLLFPVSLAGGDRIEIGSAVIHFSAGRTQQSVRVGEIDSRATVHAMDLSMVISSAIESEGGSDANGGETDLFRKIDRVAMSLLAHGPLAQLYQKIVDLVGEILTPDRVAILLPETDTGEGGDPGNLAGLDTGGDPDDTPEVCDCDSLVSRAIYRSEDKPDQEIVVSRSIARQVIEEQKAILVSDAQQDQRFQEQQSVVLQHIHSALCVPLWDEQRVIGLIYADKQSVFAPFMEKDLRLLTLLGHLAAVKIQETRAHEQLQRRRQIEEELRNASHIQQQLLPGKPLEVDGLIVAGKNIPCLGVGGDYFDYVHQSDGLVTMVLGDVSGKGMSAALIMASLHANVHALVESGYSLPDTARRLNLAMHRSAGGERFVTMFIARFDPDSGHLSYVNAGHNYPLLRRKSGEIETLETGGLMLGVFTDAEFSEGETVFEPGDRLLIYSDGVTEAENQDELDYGESRLHDFMERYCDLSPTEMVRELFDDVHRFIRPQPPGDDITVVVADRL